MRMWPLCSSSSIYMITVCMPSLVAYVYLSDFVSLVVMSNWPPCACLVQVFFISSVLRMYISLRKASSDEEMATLLHFSCICLSVCFCFSLVVMRKWPPCSSLLLATFIYPSVYSCIFLVLGLVVMGKWPPCSSLVLSALIYLST